MSLMGSKHVGHHAVATLLGAVATLTILDGLPDISELMADPFLDLPPLMPHTDRKACANSNKYNVCKAKAEVGHIYCTSCRVATGGYLRYNRRVRPTAHNL